MKRTATVAGVVAGILLVGGGIAYASIPGTDGVINGCRKNTDGSLRVVDSTASCPSGYTALNWRQVDPTVVTSAVTLSFDADGVNGTAVACPAGRLATGGGAAAATSSPLVLTSTWPVQSSGALTGWQAIWRNTSGSAVSDIDVTIYAICTGR